MSATSKLLRKLRIASGLLAYVGAASAIHQTPGAILFGMGIVSVALAVVIVRLTEIRDSLGEK